MKGLFLGVWPEDAEVHQAEFGSRPTINLCRFTKTLSTHCTRSVVLTFTFNNLLFRDEFSNSFLFLCLSDVKAELLESN